MSSSLEVDRWAAAEAKKPAPTGTKLSLVERTIAPLGLMVFAPPLTLVLWIIITSYGGSVADFVTQVELARFVAQLPRPSLWAGAVVLGWSAFQWMLLRFLPGPKHLGPVTPAGARPAYRKNGVAAWVVSHVVLMVGFASGLLSATSFFAHYGEMLATLVLCGFGFCLFLYAKAHIAPNSPDRVKTGHLLFDFFQGVELHPRVFDTSMKQLINCRVSMMGWSAIVVAACAYEIERTGSLSNALFASSVLVVAYLFKFFVWETGYFGSLDIMHDRFGFYICWGVLAWVPAVYPIAQLYLVAHPVSLAWYWAALIVVAGLAALWMNYAADEQRIRVRATKGECSVWGSRPRVIAARYHDKDGVEHENLLLTSGYWGLSRHFHYVPEISLAFFWTLPALFGSVLPYFYVIYLTILLVHRAHRDDERCAAKYGTAWSEYRSAVPYRIVPGVY